MRSYYLISLLLLISLVVSSCKNDVTDVGESIQPDEDKIEVKADTFHLLSGNHFVDAIYSRPDSFLLGSYTDPTYGTTHADILAQFKFPFEDDSFRYPDNAVFDSVALSLAYKTWFGADNSTMAVNVYRMNKNNIFDYSTFYPSNLNPNDYVDFNQSGVLLGERVFTAKDATGTKDSTRITIKLSDTFLTELTGMIDKNTGINTQEEFINRFNGMYITSSFGDATMMHIRSKGINAYLYYHYIAKIGDKDTVFNNVITIPANNEVTQINRFQHPDTAQIKTYLAAHEEINYVASPANIYTKITLPLQKLGKQMQDTIGEDKRLVINSAIIRFKAINLPSSTDTLATPISSSMLLMPSSQVNTFFSKKNLPNDSILSSDFSSSDSSYTFNVARLINHEIKKVNNDVTQLNEELELFLLPVRISKTYNERTGTYIISEVKQQILMSGVTLRSGKDKTYPLKVDVVYSGF